MSNNMVVYFDKIKNNLKPLIIPYLGLKQIRQLKNQLGKKFKIIIEEYLEAQNYE